MTVPTKASEALLAIRHRFEPGGDGRYICWALDDPDDDTTPPAAVLRAKDLITKLLQGWTCLEVWLLHEHNIDAHVDHDADKLQATRLAWIDDMIAWHQARGD